MLSSLLHFLKRSPRAGDGKDPIMSQSNPSPGVPAPAAPAPDVGQQIAQLTEAVNRLVQAQARQPAPAAPASAPDASPPPDVGGEITGGAALAPAVDYAKLSPVQQITLGLRDAKPVGPAHRRAMLDRDARPAPSSEAHHDVAPDGAD